MVELDYDAPALRVYDPAKYEYSGAGQAVPFISGGATPRVTVTLAFPRGNPILALLVVDSGCGRPAAYLSKSFIDRHGIMDKVANTTPESWAGFADGQPRVLSVRPEKLTVGAFDLPRPLLFLAQVPGFGGRTEPDGLLCSDFLRRFKLIFDYPRERLILEPARAVTR